MNAARVTPKGILTAALSGELPAWAAGDANVQGVLRLESHSPANGFRRSGWTGYK